MIRPRLCDVLGIEYPVALGGMPTVYNTPTLTAAVSEAGGIGIIGCTYLDAGAIADVSSQVRARTDKPFGLNALLFLDDQAGYTAMLTGVPALISLSWPHKDQDIEPWVDKAHAVGSTVSFMAADVPDAVRGAEAGADVIVAQGTEGGGHVGWMGLSVLLPLVVDAVAPLPVVAAGGIADGRGLVAALAEMRRFALGWVLGVVAAACASGTTENSIIATSSTYGSQVEEEAVLGGEDEQAMDSVTVGGPGLVAVGFDAPGDDGDAAVWTSPDGLSWTRGSCRREPLITLT